LHPLILIGVAVLLAAAATALDRVASRVVRPMPVMPDVTVPDLGMVHDDLEIPSGRETLHAWMLHPTGDAHDLLVLLAHGWGANYGTLLRLAEPLVDAGFEVLLFDIRGHGRNAEVAHATVRHFRDDVMAAASYAELHFPGRPLVLLGHSLGGAAGVLAAAEGTPFAGIGLLASPAGVLEVTARYMTDHGLPGALMVLILRPFWWMRVGGSFRPLTPARRIREVKVPVLVVQPENDRRVPMAHAELLAGRAGTKAHVIAGAGHTDFLGRNETHAHVLRFLRELGRA